MRLNDHQMIEEIKGWAEVIEIFGRTPNFHDSEITKIELLRGPQRAEVVLHAWKTDQSRLDENGYFVKHAHTLLCISVYKVSSLILEDWNNQNVVDNLSITKQDNEFTLRISPSYGLQGAISGKGVEVRVASLDGDRAKNA